MNYTLIFSIARALLVSRLRQTLVAAIGVTFSITMFIALLGFMTGLNKMLDSLVLNRTPHIRLFTEIKPNPVQPVSIYQPFRNHYNFISSIKADNSRDKIYNSRVIEKILRQDSRIAGIAPKINTQVFYNDGTVNLTGALSGIDVAEETRLFNFQDYIVGGNAFGLQSNSNSIILGKTLAEKLHANTGDLVQVITPNGDRFPLRLVGLYQSGLNEFDKTQGFASVSTAQKLMGKPDDYITDIQIKLKNITAAPAIAAEYAAKFDTDAEDIQTANAQFETGNFIRTLISYAVGITLLIVAGFGIYNILNMLIYEKMDTIAILKATGFAGKDVKLIFIFIALSIGLAGGLTGLVFGFGLSSLIDQVPFHTASLPTISTYPVNYDPAIYLTALIFSLATTWMAGLFPARKASKIDPVIIIRGK